jgi:hypothetical protein
MNNIDSEHIEKIVDSLEKNFTILYFHYKQYGQEIKQQVIQKIDEIINRNRDAYKEETGIDCSNEHQRLMKHSRKVLNIDSIYRNNMK